MNDYAKNCTNEFIALFPKRHIVFLDGSTPFDFIDETHRDGYVRFNLEIYSQMLSQSTLEFEIIQNGVLIFSDSPEALFRTLLFDCIGVGQIRENGVFLSARAFVCDIMRVICGIMEIFKK